jgi:glucose-6-phosphate 1-dehydrogenase
VPAACGAAAIADEPRPSRATSTGPRVVHCPHVALGELNPTDNPLVAGLERLPVRSTAVVIFGATGDLAGRKLLPAIYNLAHEGSLPEHIELAGVARGDISDEDFRASARESIARFTRRPASPDVLDGLLENARFVGGNFDDPDVYLRLARTLADFDEHAGQPLNRIFYLSTAPEFFPVIIGLLGEAGLNESAHDAEVRVVIEKPFGYDLASALTQNEAVRQVFDESQVFRIDHYLGKETVQNLIALRFANALFEPVWNRNFIDHVQITAAEDLGIGGRAGYYEGAGALRDLVQNHMLQLLALLAMEPPTSFDAKGLRDEKAKLLNSILPPDPARVSEMTVRAQYGPGVVAGQPVPGYLEEPGVAPDSRTETYTALRLEISNWRWAGVPFYLRTGKRLPRKLTEIAITLKPVPHLAFQSEGSLGVQPNQIVLTVQPDEGVSVSLGAKIPGTRMRIRPVNMEFHYGTSFLSESPEAYERLILDAMRGDATLFTRSDEVEALWKIVDPILAGWAADTESPIPQYSSGSSGPAVADELLGDTRWRRL